MSWWGKLLGGAFGWMLGGPLGALIGAALGHQFDRGIKGLWEGEEAGFAPGDQERVQSAFFTASFSVMGHLAKVDGRVSEDEIELARAVMAHMNLSPEMRKVAIRLFTEGKDPDFPLQDVVVQFRKECHRRRVLMQMFVEIQLHAAYADGAVHAAERRLLEEICDLLGFSRAELDHLEAMVAAQRHYAGAGAREAPQPGASLAEAYAVLGVERSAPDAEVKRAYRRLMNQHHPDKLVAKGLPEEMMQLAKEKTQEIKGAYEQIKEARAMK